VLYAGFIALSAAGIIKTVAIIYSTDFFILLSFCLLLLDALVPVFILVSIILITPFSNYQKKRILQKSRHKMELMKKVKTIGITGSFGKTSTKEFLYAILSQKYKVVKTSGNNNTAMGVANTILRDVNDEFDYFICEMGAYRIGEIEEICGLAEPFAGIITGINEQHIDLFGSIENTKRAKFELVQSLPEDGFAVVNREAQKRRPKLSYKVKDVALFSSDMAESIKVNPDSVEFDYKNVHFTVNMLGKHYIGNLISAIISCEKLGMDLEEIRDAAAKLEIKSDYLMQKLEGPHGSIFINDSYSANPDGVIAALEYLEDAYPEEKKILVFPGIIELGKNSEAVHEKIRRKTEAACQFAYILQKEDKKPRKPRGECRFVFGKDFDKMKEEVKKRIDKNSVVLFEGRGAGVVMKKLLDANRK
jgi:UDP-N-acetylmuramoyl-tripeptide--D-alanyl-D-alanine ligase